jgi:hypothetical protein
MHITPVTHVTPKYDKGRSGVQCIYLADDRVKGCGIYHIAKRVPPAVGQENETKCFSHSNRRLFRLVFIATAQHRDNNDENRHCNDAEMAFHDLRFDL